MEIAHTHRKGRRSAASNLVTLHPVQVEHRLRAPKELMDEEVEIWQSVVDSRPADWFSPGNVPLLTQYCRHVIQARRIAEWIEKAPENPKLKIIDYDRLLKMQRDESAIIAMLATKMRLAQQSLTNHRGNTISQKAPKAFRPWEG